MVIKTALVKRPVAEKYPISAEFGSVNPKLRGGKPHKGVDFVCPELTPVMACFDGVIALLRTKDQVSNAISAMPDGSAKEGNRVGLYCRTHRALYFHLDKFLVEPNQPVKKGDIIALSGNTGYTTGPHLHFQLEDLNSNQPIKPEFENETTASA